MSGAPGKGVDPLLIAAIIGMLIVGVIAVIDLIQDGSLDATLLALVVSIFGPLVPALIVRSRSDDSRKEDR